MYLSKDRTLEDRERHKKCVDELKQKMSDCLIGDGQFGEDVWLTKGNLSDMDSNIILFVVIFSFMSLFSTSRN